MTGLLGGLAGGAAAKGLWDAMWALYDRKYGKHGEARVRALQAQIVKQQRTIDGHVATIRAAEELVRVLEHDLDDTDDRLAAAEARANGLAARVNELEAAANVVPLPDNPYADGTEVPR